MVSKSIEYPLQFLIAFSFNFTEHHKNVNGITILLKYLKKHTA
jgi:hypothetical protein